MSPNVCQSLLVQILPDHVRRRGGDTRFVGAEHLPVGRAEPHAVGVRGDRVPALPLHVVGRLPLQRVGHLGRLHLAAEQAREGVADRALQLAFEALDDAHRFHLLRSAWLRRRVRTSFTVVVLVVVWLVVVVLVGRASGRVARVGPAHGARCRAWFPQAGTSAGQPSSIDPQA